MKVKIEFLEHPIFLELPKIKGVCPPKAHGAIAGGQSKENVFQFQWFINLNYNLVTTVVLNFNSNCECVDAVGPRLF